jgi:hypothetical protein
LSCDEGLFECAAEVRAYAGVQQQASRLGAEDGRSIASRLYRCTISAHQDSPVKSHRELFETGFFYFKEKETLRDCVC